MAFHESALSRSWRDTERTRGSLAWWIAAVITGAMLAVAAYYIAPGDSSLIFAFGGVVVGFFAPYALALVWNLPQRHRSLTGRGLNGARASGITQRR